MQKTRATLAAAAVLAITGSVLALDGKDGYAATQLFLWGDVRTQVEYHPAFTGPQWPDLTGSHLGAWGSVGPASIATNADGDLMYLVNGWRGYRSYIGLIHFDGTTHRQLLQSNYHGLDQVGDRIDAVRVSPVTSGRLTAGHPVCLRQQIPGSAELVSVDPDTWAETIVHTFPGPRALRFDIADDGRIFAILWDDGLHELTWNSGTASYDDVAVTTSFPVNQDSDVLAGPDGFAYTFSDYEPSWHVGLKDTRSIYRVDPATGAHTVYAGVANWTFLFDWAFDTDGTLFLAMADSRRKFVARVVPGATTGRGNAISTSNETPYGLGSGPDGKLVVRELVSVDGGDGHLDPMHELVPSSDGGGGGGGGKGGGKGKNK